MLECFCLVQNSSVACNCWGSTSCTKLQCTSAQDWNLHVETIIWTAAN